MGVLNWPTSKLMRVPKLLTKLAVNLTSALMESPRGLRYIVLYRTFFFAYYPGLLVQFGG